MRPPGSAEARLRDRAGVSLLALLDGKPLPVSGVTKDPDATPGPSTGGRLAKGYKLHALWANRAAPEAWEVAPMNVSEKAVARELFAQAPGAGYVLADGNYDGNPLFDTAAAQGYQLVINKQTKQWGTEYKPEMDLVRVPLTSTTLSAPVEQFTIAIEPAGANAGTLALRWDNLQLTAPIAVK